MDCPQPDHRMNIEYKNGKSWLKITSFNEILLAVQQKKKENIIPEEKSMGP